MAIPSNKRRRVILTQNLKKAAISYAKAGYRVFPLHTPEGDGCSCGKPNCPSIGKHPRIKDWPNKATTDLKQIREWWKRWPNANIAIATGDDLVVLDVDRDHDGFESLERLEREYELLPVTPTVETGGGGRHFWMISATPIRNSAGKLGDGLDIRGVGGYIIAPPSHHKSGRRYRFANGSGPSEINTAELPDWMEEILCDSSFHEQNTRRDWEEIAQGSIRTGSRNNTVTSIIGHLLSNRVDPYLARTLVHAWNESQNQPPLSFDEVERTVNSIAQRELCRRRGGHYA